jgi:integrase
VPLRQLTTPALTRLRAELSREGAGDATVLKAFTMLQSVLSHAVVEGHLDHNPARAVRKPRQRRERKVDPLPPETIERLRAEFLKRGDRASALVVCLIAYAGLRTLSEIGDLEMRDLGTRVMRVNARKTGRMRSVDLLEPLGADLMEWVARLGDVPPKFPRRAALGRRPPRRDRLEELASTRLSPGGAARGSGLQPSVRPPA